jgi:hypothetical protein
MEYTTAHSKQVNRRWMAKNLIALMAYRLLRSVAAAGLLLLLPPEYIKYPKVFVVE